MVRCVGDKILCIPIRANNVFKGLRVGEIYLCSRNGKTFIASQIEEGRVPGRREAL